MKRKKSPDKSTDKKSRRALLWVEVRGKDVHVRSGPKMPQEPASAMSMLYSFGGNSFSRDEFARWSGIKFPKGDGIYGLALDFSVVAHYRRVIEETAKTVIEKQGRWFEVKR